MFSATAATLEAELRPFALPGLDGAHIARAGARVHPINLERYRPALMMYARRCLRNPADAEDAVQDTLAAALDSTEFAGRSSISTWLHGILKHKIIDIYRQQAREPVREAPPEEELQTETNALFTPDGHWRDSPARWGDPEAALAGREFEEVLESCLACLPVNCARAFRLREVMGLEVAEVCEVLGVSANNCYVMLHRARLRLRTLLEQRWFSLQT